MCSSCCRKANQADPVQSVQIFTNYGTFVLQGFDENGLGEILRNVCVPLSRFVECSMVYKHLYPEGAGDAAATQKVVWVRIQSKTVGVPVDSQCTPETIKTRMTSSKPSFKGSSYKMYLNGNVLQVCFFCILRPLSSTTNNWCTGSPAYFSAGNFLSVLCSFCHFQGSPVYAFLGSCFWQHNRSCSLPHRLSALLRAREWKCMFFAHVSAHPACTFNQKCHRL